MKLSKIIPNLVTYLWWFAVQMGNITTLVIIHMALGDFYKSYDEDEKLDVLVFTADQQGINMTTAFKKNVGKTLITKKGKKCKIISVKKHSYHVMSSDRDVDENGFVKTFDGWGFDIVDDKSEVLYEK